MRLVTVPQLAKELFISTGLVRYWLRTDRLTKHPRPLTPGSSRVKKRTVSHYRYLLDIDEAAKLLRNRAESDLKLLHSDKRLLRPQEVAGIIGVTVQRVYQWASRYELTKYPTGSGTCYLLDGDELADALEENGLGHLVK